MQKGFSAGCRELIDSIPEALAVTEHVCSSVNIGSTKAGINMDAVALMGRIVREAAERTTDRDLSLIHISILLEGLHDGMDEFERERLIHDRLIRWVEYDVSQSKPHIHTLYLSLIHICSASARIARSMASLPPTVTRISPAGS